MAAETTRSAGLGTIPPTQHEKEVKPVKDGAERPFKAGRLKDHLQEWKKLTTDPFILNMVQGATIPLEEFADRQVNPPNQIQGNLWVEADKEIEKLLKIGAIEVSQDEEGQNVSPIFLVPKPDGTYRLILNLKKFNENVQYEHFKMENLQSATGLMKQGCYMASVDLRHAYYSVPVAQEFRKYLKFKWRGILYSYTCLPNGLSCCPRYFTKLLKPVYAHLRSQGWLSAAFIDDSYLQGDTQLECKMNVEKTVNLFKSLGFFVHSKKSVTEPKQKLKYLGFYLNSKDMTVTLTEERATKLKTACLGLKAKKKFTIRELAQLIGQMVAAFPAVEWGPLYYRRLDKDKSEGLKNKKGDFDAVISLSQEATVELDWWIHNVKNSVCHLQRAEASVQIMTDASTSGGWGAVCMTHNTGGRWKKEEESYHINVLELIAIEYAMKSFEKVISGKHVKVLTDNTCAVTYIKNMGGSHSTNCNTVANRIWKWCQDKNVWITIAHIPGKCNGQADQKSRKFNDNTEWKLDSIIFHKIVEKLGTPSIDLFASRLNCQLSPFVSWHPDPEAFSVDAFTINWKGWYIYAFPPFSIIQRVLQKWRNDKAVGIMVVPDWTTAVWYPQLLAMLTHPPILLPKRKKLLQLTHSEELHPLHKKLQLLAVQLSGRQSEHKAFLEKLRKSYVLRGDCPLRNNTNPTSGGGKYTVINGIKIPFVQL